MDILKQALSIMRKQSFSYYKWSNNSVNDMGIKIDNYETAVVYKGSIQAVPLSKYEKLGLQFANNYRIVYSSLNIKGIEGQPSPDKLVFEGKTWKIIKNTSWFVVDGWTETLVVEVVE